MFRIKTPKDHIASKDLSHVTEKNHEYLQKCKYFCILRKAKSSAHHVNSIRQSRLFGAKNITTDEESH